MAPGELDYRTLIERLPGMVWHAGPDASRTYFNPAWLAFTGRALEEELGAGWLDGVFGEDASTSRARYLEHFASREPFEIVYRLRRFDGAYRSVVDRGAPHADGRGEFAGFVGTTIDVTGSDSHELSAVARDFFAMSLDNLTVAGFDGYLKRVNPSWTRTLGWSAEELMSRPSIEFVHPDDRASTLGGRNRLTTGTLLGELVNRYRCKDGTYRWFEWRSVADVERGLVYAAARDVTDQKRAEERLQEANELQKQLQRQLIFADRMALVGTFGAGVAHEVNNPLAIVMANNELILERLEPMRAELPQDVAELIELATDVQLGAERIQKIVGGLKTFARAEGERLTVIEVIPSLELAIEMTQHEFRQHARLVKELGRVPSVLADEARLGQLFIHLLVNAAQAIPVGNLAAHEIRIVTSTDAAGRAVIEIRDSGAGIPAPLLSRIFDPFFTTKPIGIGTGLGLSICHNIVTMMGGTIAVASDEGRGTTFRVVLEAAPPPASATREAS